jgi:hypothetical protein
VGAAWLRDLPRIEFRAAAARTTNVREPHYLTTKAARLATERHSE